MKKMMIGLVCSVFLMAGIGAVPVHALTVPVDLTDFYLEGVGSIAPDGSSAWLAEDPIWGSTLLQNDPFFWGDPGISVPLGAQSLSFDFDFVEVIGNDTEFYVRLFDGNTGNFIDDWFIGDPFTTGEIVSGTHIFDLSTLLLPGQDLLGLEFYLDEYNVDTGTNLYRVGSTVGISNLHLTVPDQPIPEPGTLLLLGVGLSALSVIRRKRT